MWSLRSVTPRRWPDTIDALRGALAAERLARREAEARARAEAMVAHLKLLIAKLSTSASAPLPSAAASCSTSWSCSSRNSRPQPARTNWRPDRDGAGRRGPASARAAQAGARSLPAHLPRERVVSRHLLPARAAAAARQAGEDVTETLEVVPRHWKVSRPCASASPAAPASVSAAAAPFHPIARGRRAGAAGHDPEPSLASTCRSTARARPCAEGSATSRPWPTGSAPARALAPLTR